MRVLVQRVKSASVRIDGRDHAVIGPGLLAFAGLAEGDSAADCPWFADKLVGLRVFPDDAGKMGRSLAETGGEILVVSQFTLYGSVTRGLRPDFRAALGSREAEPLFAQLVTEIQHRHPGRVQTGVFGADMEVELVNWGPVTILLEKEGDKHARGAQAAAGGAGRSAAPIVEGRGDAPHRVSSSSPLSI